jgi:Pyridoxamine 5'-phosphate oxidase
MSIPVSLDRLAEALGDFGAGYLLSVSGDGRVKVVTVEPTVADGAVLVAGPGGGTLANLAGNPQVTLAFPPPLPMGFTLLVDGTAEVAGDDVRITPSGAVLHRPAAHSDGPPAPGMSAEAESPTACGDDCHPV